MTAKTIRRYLRRKQRRTRERLKTRLRDLVEKQHEPLPEDPIKLIKHVRTTRELEREIKRLEKAEKIWGMLRLVVNPEAALRLAKRRHLYKKQYKELNIVGTQAVTNIRKIQRETIRTLRERYGIGVVVAFIEDRKIFGGITVSKSLSNREWNEALEYVSQQNRKMREQLTVASGCIIAMLMKMRTSTVERAQAYKYAQTLANTLSEALEMDLGKLNASLREQAKKELGS
jgi:hypothetical protein